MVADLVVRCEECLGGDEWFEKGGRPRVLCD
jgi:hypothetical protein